MIGTISRRCGAVLACAGLASSSAAGPGVAEHALLIVDPSRPDALWAANEYIAARGLPETSVVYMTPDAQSFADFTDRNLVALFGEIDARGLAGRADYIIIAPPSRYRMAASATITNPCSPVRNFGISSAYTMAFMADEVLGGLPVTRFQPFHRPIGEPRGFDSEVAYAAGEPSTSSLARRVYISGLLGWTGERGNTIAEVVDMVQRSAAADGTLAGGADATYYFMNTSDAARNVRQPQFGPVIDDLLAKGTDAVQVDGVLPTGGVVAAGVMTGAATPDIDGGDFTFSPGAFADHLTSFAGHFGTASQTKMSRWIAKGALGTSGTVEEPCNFTGKFPHARLHYFYDQGATQGEAYLRSIGFLPFQVQFLGDPLARPYTYIPEVSLLGLPTVGVGEVAFTPTATTDKPGAAIARHVVLVNGRTVAEVDDGQEVRIDTTLLPDGSNEVRVISYDDTPLESRGSATTDLLVQNDDRFPTLTPSRDAGGFTDAFRFEVQAPGATGVRLLQNGRVLGATDDPEGAIVLFGANLGAGPSEVIIEASYPDGKLARSAPEPLRVDFGDVFGGAAPVAFDHTVRVRPGQTRLIDLPAAYDASPADAAYEIVAPPAGAAEVLWHDGTGFALVRIADDATTGDAVGFEVTTAGGSARATVTLELATAPCPADLDGDGELTIFDFLTFQNLFDAGDPAADFDGDGELTIFDFLAFQNAFDAGC